MINILLSRITQNSHKNIELLNNYLHNSKGVLIFLYAFFSKYTRNDIEYEEHYGENSLNRKKVINEFEKYGVDESKLYFVNYYKTTKEEILKLLKKVDCIYFPGGAPDEMKDRLEQLDITNKLINDKFIYIGSSAGAMIQTKTMFITPDSDYTTFTVKNGLGLISNYLCEVHSHDNYQKKYNRYIVKYSDNVIISLKENSICVLKDNKIIDGIDYKVINEKKKSKKIKY